MRFRRSFMLPDMFYFVLTEHYFTRNPVFPLVFAFLRFSMTVL